jgi:hypothetical protein
MAAAEKIVMSNNVVDLHGSIDITSDAGRELIVDLARFSEGVLTEKQVRKRHRLPDATWKSMGDDDLLVEKIEAEKIRRIRDGSSKREKAQLHVTKAPDILDNIMSDTSASPRHRVDAIKVLDGLAMMTACRQSQQTNKRTATVSRNIFERLDKKSQQNGSVPQPSLRHGEDGSPMEDERTRQERLEARLDTLTADLHRFQRQT